MKAAYVDQIGPPENIRWADLPMPTVGPSDVLVKVRAVTVNPVDTYIRSGKYPIPLPKPFIVGRDMVGTVESVGSAVKGFKAGERVWANNQGYDGRQGTFAEYLSIHEDLLYRLPDGVDEHNALSLFHGAVTAAIGLFQKAAIQPGETLFLRGGSGNVGTIVLQIAKAQGARVAVTASGPEDTARCKELGADRLIDYKTEDLEAALKSFAPDGLHVYWDLTLAADLELALKVLRPRGRVVIMSGAAHRATLPIGPFYQHNITMYGFTITNATPAELRDAADRINGWLAKKQLKGQVNRVMKLDAAAEAHRLQEQGGFAGKIILTN